MLPPGRGEPTPPNAVPVPSPKIDLGRELGEGRAGVVRHGVLTEPFEDFPAGFEVAVKTLHRGDDAEARASLTNERKVLAAIPPTPGLPQLVFADDERIVTAYVPGPGLRELLDEGPLPEARARRLGGDLAAALSALHAAGFWHGDVKPENLRLNGEENLILLDLGLARRHEDQDGPVAGSLPYLAPEQCLGAAGGPAADLFALGVVLSEFATGQIPCAPGEEDQGDAQAWLEARQDTRSFFPSSIDPKLSPLFDLIVEELLDPKPKGRTEAREVVLRLREGERSEWWSAVLAGGHLARRDPRVWLETGRMPFVGRARELNQLQSAFSQVQTGQGRAVWLEGEEGSGKTRLMAEFVAAARHSTSPPIYLDGRCSEFQDERPGRALRSLLRRYLHLGRRRPLGARERSILETQVPPAWLDGLERVLDPTAEEAPPGEGEALAQSLAHLGRETPLVVFLDDVTFADPVTYDGLTRLASHLAETRILLVLGLRWGTPATHPIPLENLRARLATATPVMHLPLGALSETEVLEQVQVLFHHSAPQLRLARVLHERTAGHPGGITELLRGLLQRGEARPRRDGQGTLELLVRPRDLPEPGSSTRQFEARLEVLGEEEQRWLRRLSAVGGHLDPRFLARAFAIDEEQATRWLEEFSQEGWLVTEDGRASFGRPGYRQRLYESLESEERCDVHRAAAEAFEGKDGRDHKYQRAYHLHAAGLYEELLEVAAPLVAELQEKGHPGRIATLSTWALEGLDQLESTPERERVRIGLLVAAADAADRLGERDAQRRALDKLTDVDLEPDSQPEAVGRVYLLHGRYAANTGQYGSARGMLRNAALLFRQAEAPGREAEALLRLAHIQGHVGQIAEAQRLAVRARDLAPDSTLRARAQLALAVAALVSDEFEEALRLIDRATARLRHLDDPTGGRGALAAATLLRGRAYRLVGRPRRAFAAIGRAARLAAQAGERRLSAETSARQGRLLLDLDRSREAELVLRETVTAAQEIEYSRGQALATVFLGTLLAENGDSEAEPMLARNTDLARKLGLGRVEALSLTLRARVLRASGDSVTATEFAEEAFELFTQFGGELADRIVITGTLALLRRDHGENSAAKDLEAGIQKRIRRVNEAIQGPVLRQRQHRSARTLLRSCLSPEGPLFPRSALPGAIGDE